MIITLQEIEEAALPNTMKSISESVAELPPESQTFFVKTTGEAATRAR